MDVIDTIKQGVAKAMETQYQTQIESNTVLVNSTKKEFDGDYTVVVFPFTKAAKKGPEQIGQELGQFLKDNVDEVANFNVIKGFLNLELEEAYWLQFLEQLNGIKDYGRSSRNGKKVMVEFSSPNTNKPLHLGHIRNILLGWSCHKILDAAGYEVLTTQVINDRGLHICKSMLAYQTYGNGETPESTGMKSDHFVGKYYIKFSSVEKEQIAALKAAGKETESKDKEEPAILKEAREMLLKWEANDPEVKAIWKKMNGWVIDGFEKTYEKLGVSFDKNYLESETYLKGKEFVMQGLEKDIFYQKEDKSIWIDLEDVKLDHKTVLRGDGTSLYVTQDLGTANQRYQDYGVDKMVYVVGDEQNYHFKVLFEILKRLDQPYANDLYHLSYGMVDLPSGKMKSREGTVVDADDLIAEVIKEAKNNAEEKGGLEDFDEAQKNEVYRKIGLAALKYFILKVNPQKRMLFDPKESVDLQGNTGPYIQNAFVRISSVVKKAGTFDAGLAKDYKKMEPSEKELAFILSEYPGIVQIAAENYDPSTMASYCFELAKTFHRFYHDVQIMRADTEAAKAFRILLAGNVASVLESGMDLLGVEMPERM